jgi:polyhydroxybutyrate depolymerase
MSMRTLLLPLLAALAGAVHAASAFAALAPGDYTRTLVFDSQTREYDVHVPASYDGSQPVPLAVDMHGFSSNKGVQRAISGMQARSNAEGFIAVYPQGLFNSWNAGTCCGQAVAQNIDDVGFLRAMVAAVSAEANIDPRRIYATGLSNGGAMTQRLACEAADLFAAAAPMAFPIPFAPLSTCQPSRPIAVLMFMGLTDQLVSYATAGPSFQYWRTFDGCAGGSPDESVVTGDSFCDTYTQCDAGVEAGLCSILSTSPAPYEGHVLYFNNDLNLSVAAWNFLSRFQLPAAEPPALDPFKCYKVKDLHEPKFQSTTVSLSDQFAVNDGEFEVQKPFLLCNPADENGAGITNAADHLTCYKVKGPALAVADRPRAEVTNELGTLQIEATKAFLLCVPSAKTVLPD